MTTDTAHKTYDPFARGPQTVGVRTLTVTGDGLGAASVPVEIWYPAAATERGRDLDPAAHDRFAVAPTLPIRSQDAVRDAAPAQGAFPLLVYCHGGNGHRRECTHLCTHVASHGYVVVAGDFPGDNLADLMPRPDGSTPVIANRSIDESAHSRPRQASAVIDAALSAELRGNLPIDATRIATAGFSMGGYTALAVNSIDRRPSAVFAMCPMVGASRFVPQTARLASLLRVDDWGRPVPVCVLSGEVDPMVPAESVRGLHGRLAEPSLVVLLARAGHMHWADDAEGTHEYFRGQYLSGAFPDPELDAAALGDAMRPFSELCPAADAATTARGLCVAHLDAHLKRLPGAAAFLNGDLRAAFTARGIALETHSRSAATAGRAG